MDNERIKLLKKLFDTIDLFICCFVITFCVVELYLLSLYYFDWPRFGRSRLNPYPIEWTPKDHEQIVIISSIVGLIAASIGLISTIAGSYVFYICPKCEKTSKIHEGEHICDNCECKLVLLDGFYKRNSS